MAQQIDIYTTPTCAFCKATKEFLTEHNIAYTEHDVAESKENREAMVELSGQMGVPVIKIGEEEIIVGFNKNKLKEVLGINE